MVYFHKRSHKRIAVAKRKARSELKPDEWDCLGYSRLLNLNPEDCLDNIERVDASTLSYEEFVERYEKPLKPVILTGLTNDWPATSKWTIPRLLKKYRNQKFKCGEDDEGYSVKLKMKYYIDYMLTTQDDSPLYIFDSGFGDRNKTNKLLDDYKVPHYFSDDLFRYASEKRRPPYRWMVIGPPRSGTAIHIDPLGTSAWNALIVGHKRWCLIHPNAPKTLVKPTREESGKHPDEAVNWFNTVYHRVIKLDWPEQFPVVHALQKPGDLMFVPSGWWHVVMNLDHTIAVTQNFCSLSNLKIVWPKTIKGRPKLSTHWLRSLRVNRPEIMPIINEINRKANWSIDDSSSDSSSSSSSSSDSSDSENEVHFPHNDVNGSISNGNSVSNGDRKRKPSMMCGIEEETSTVDCMSKRKKSPPISAS
uniref:JmjC domain-containing protein n=1 Tax=Acrobeloides nanus TaxID=290746 RepID=A0A914DN24_9BILA